MNVTATTFLFVTALAAFLVGLAKGGLGGLLAVLATPLMTLVLPPQQALGLVLPMLMISDFFSLTFYWKQWNWHFLHALLPGSIIGIIIGSLIINSLPTRIFQTGLGLFVLLFIVYKLFEKKLVGTNVYQNRRWHGHLAGVFSGLTSALAHTGGPPVTIYLLLQNLSPLEFNATCVFFFMALNLVKAPFYYFSGLFDFERFMQIIWLMPLIPIGVWVGIWGSSRIDKKAFDRVIISLLALTGILLIIN